MSKHMPDAPIANRSEKCPGDHHEVASDTRQKRRPDELSTADQQTGSHGQYHAEHDEQGFLPRKTHEIAILPACV